ncbi:NF-X1-type zinc finger protein NFXL1 [Araneus ventricosus]|uniref:NF-X1-type zinc finger protein NFXL1 n=1 Tax=Araneus ventricosus TaxID=182803 RepID=A0A4Y2HIL6_ARAVE|nr:NF-X1-type zinc finger protein NFXL1 [Araneus ventricosus]
MSHKVFIGSFEHCCFRLPSDCHHPERQKHKCHFGACPPCRLTCGKTLDCGHTCSFKCHSAVLTRIETKQKKEGPWDLRNSYRMELICKPCPPCPFPIPVTCLGGHEVQNLPCSSAQSTSCGRKCRRPLSCGNHTCSLECHSVNNINDLTKASDKCETCEESCKKPQKPGCTHPCPLPCHSGKCKPCKQHIKLKCHCQINIMYILCDEWTSADENKKAELMCCSNRCPKEVQHKFWTTYIWSPTSRPTIYGWHERFMTTGSVLAKAGHPSRSFDDVKLIQETFHRPRRRIFTGKMLQKIEEDENFLQHVMFSDEATFHISGIVNRHNTRIWGLENFHAVLEQARDSPKVNVWCGLLHD